MTASRLAALLDKAMGDDPWYMPGYGEIRTKHPDEIRLIALAPDMARLLVDMADYIREIGDALSMMGETVGVEKEQALLARFAALDEKAGGA